MDDRMAICSCIAFIWSNSRWKFLHVISMRLPARRTVNPHCSLSPLGRELSA